MTMNATKILIFVSVEMYANFNIFMLIAGYFDAQFNMIFTFFIAEYYILNMTHNNGQIC